MSLDYWHLSMGTVQLALEHHGFEFEPFGSTRFRFLAGKDSYYILCGKLPELFIERCLDIRTFLEAGCFLEDLLTAMNAVNGDHHLVKVSSMKPPIVRFTLCLREDRYPAFRDNLIGYVRELDDAVESFRIACQLYREPVNPSQEELDRFWASSENPFHGILDTE